MNFGKALKEGDFLCIGIKILSTLTDQLASWLVVEEAELPLTFVFFRRHHAVLYILIRLVSHVPYAILHPHYL